MELTNRSAEIFIPDNKPVGEAVERTTHMAISAHQDDLEIMAYDGILECFGSDRKWFFGVVATNGSGSPRDGLYRDYTDEEMMKVRKQEQKKAAFVGEYAGAALLDYPSSAIKDPENTEVVDEFKRLIAKASPELIYTHNLTDKHDTHVGVCIKVIQALRELAVEARPEILYGCEVWRGLDWMFDQDKVMFDVAGHPNLESSLLGIYDSQVCGGKRYDRATIGRRLANATYADTHAVDETDSLIYAMDLTPLINNRDLDIIEYAGSLIENFKKDVIGRIKKLC